MGGHSSSAITSWPKPLLALYLLYLLPMVSSLHDDSYLPAPKLEYPTAPESVPLSLGDQVLLKQLSPKSLEP